ncbi:Ribosomal RNA processing protein 1-like protein B [Sciurus carolinensis]|uniref:Ribosomal RNA processing protein 1-like protein B n=1 Tax=Sciurus carolinensis TaxID=30640 RepID=A0AA41MSM0_SCICA|nr:Ribosomal RNA processing protein 1-like protein B [Sciurus carolinensis]
MPKFYPDFYDTYLTHDSQFMKKTPREAALPRAGVKSSTREEGSSELTVPMHNRRKRLRRKSPKAQGEIWGDSVELPLDDKSRSSPGSSQPQIPATRASPTDEAQVLKRKQKLGVLLINCTLTHPPLNLAEGEHDQATLSQCRRPQTKKAEPSSSDLYNLFNEKTTVLKKREKMKEMLN